MKDPSLGGHAISRVDSFSCSGAFCFRVLWSALSCFGVFDLRFSFLGLRFLHYRIGGMSIYFEKVGKSINTSIKNFVIALHKKLMDHVYFVCPSTYRPTVD